MTDAPALEYDVASALSQGARSRQEDALAVAFADGAPEGFAILSDGMGGHAAGDLASRTIVSEAFAVLTLPTEGADPQAVLADAVERANARVRVHATTESGNSGMGGTIIAARVADAALHWASVGDSVLYLFRGETLTRLNADHSMAPQLDLMAANGALTHAEATSHPQRNCLTSALTGQPIAEMDCPDIPVELRNDDIVLLASDGLQYLPDPIIEALLLRARGNSSRHIARDLLDALATLNDPEQDNTALVVIRPIRPRPRARRIGLLNTPAAMVKAMRKAVGPSVRSVVRRS